MEPAIDHPDGEAKVCLAVLKSDMPTYSVATLAVPASEAGGMAGVEPYRMTCVDGVVHGVFDAICVHTDYTLSRMDGGEVAQVGELSGPVVGRARVTAPVWSPYPPVPAVLVKRLTVPGKANVSAIDLVGSAGARARVARGVIALLPPMGGTRGS